MVTPAGAHEPSGEPGGSSHDPPAPAVTPVGHVMAGVDPAGAHQPSGEPGGPTHDLPAPTLTPVSHATAGVDLADAPQGSGTSVDGPLAYPQPPTACSMVCPAAAPAPPRSHEDLILYNQQVNSPKTLFYLNNDGIEEIVSVCTPNGPLTFDHHTNDTMYATLHDTNFYSHTPLITIT